MKKDSILCSKELRKIILDTALQAGAKSAHLGGALSIVDVISVLYSKSFLKFDSKNPKSPERDRLILSKGHCCLAYYALLNLMGFICKDDLSQFESDGAILLGHPVKNLEKGIEFSTGSLGMGISIAIGICLAAKLNSKNFHVFSIIGDGEANEGSVWEAIMAAPNFNINNLTIILDKNNYQQTGSTLDIMNNDNFYEKFKSFGWQAYDIDGHNHAEIEKALKEKSNKPKAIIANTIKGKGFSFSENNNNWHHSVLTKKIYDEAILELQS